LPFNALIEIDAIFEIREVPASTYINPTPINGDLA
jgi:hypothetical protein